MKLTYWGNGHRTIGLTLAALLLGLTPSSSHSHSYAHVPTRFAAPPTSTPASLWRTVARGSTVALVVVDAAIVPPAALSPQALLTLGLAFHNSLGLGTHRHIVPLPILRLGSPTIPTVRTALAIIKKQHPVRLYLLGMTHAQRLAFVTETLYADVAVYINKTPGPLHSLPALNKALAAARHFVPVITGHGTGARLANADQVAADTALVVPQVSTPSSYSLDPNLIPPVGDQGQQGSCVAWSTSYYYKTYQEAKEHHWSVTDPGHDFSPAFVYNQINGGKNNGSTFSDAMTLITQQGDVPLSAFPYNQQDYLTQPSAATIASGGPYRARDFGYLFSHSTTDALPYNNDIQRLKQWLASGDGFVLSIPVFDSFQQYSGSVYGLDSLTPQDFADAKIHGVEGHALFVIGYNDNVENTGIGAFKIVNSWGTTWGEHGYIWLGYDYVTELARDAWAMYDALNDPAGAPDVSATPTILSDLPTATTTPNPNPAPSDTPNPNPNPAPIDTASPSPNVLPSETPNPNPIPNPPSQPVVYRSDPSSYTLIPHAKNHDFIAQLDFVVQGVQGNRIVEQHHFRYYEEVSPYDDEVFSINYHMKDGTPVSVQLEVITGGYAA